MKPGVIQLLPKFHGLDSENPYLHLKEFDEVCATLQYNNITDDVNAQVWETTNTIERAKPGPSSKGGLYYLKEEDDVNSRIAKLTRKVEAIELGKTESKAPTSFESSCGICETNSHLTKDCPTIPAFQEVLHEQANVANAYRRPFSSPYSETYNSNWQNHPNFSWRNGPSINESQGSSSHAPYVPPHKKSLEDTLSGIMKLTFGNMTIELIVFNIGKQPAEEDSDTYEVNMIQTLVEGKFAHPMFSDPIEACLLNPNNDDVDLDTVNALLDATPTIETNRWKPCFEELPTPSKLLPSNVQAPKLDLKPLPSYLKYAYLGQDENFPVVISVV
uniref:Uncharacterized protein n=1 Tax=Fagus sylvatica TaxID=28930 RepID=A0A2N9IZH7_FAGSY